MKVNEFLSRLEDLMNYNTLYVMGCFGSPLNTTNKTRYTKNNAYNRQEARVKMIQNASPDTFGFDCVCMIKGILWGWCGDVTKKYGGATYTSNGVPDVSANGIIKRCDKVSTDFTTIQKGELVWTDGHVGIYVGSGRVIECSPRWSNGVQYSWLGNLPQFRYGNFRVWSKHGFLPYVDYDDVTIIKEQDSKYFEYTVVSGDTLWNISKKYLGKGSRYVEIYKLNELKTNVLKVGQILKIPM